MPFGGAFSRRIGEGDRSTENLIDFNGGGVGATAPPPKATRKATTSLGGGFADQSFKA
jgi:hypothetical protein